MKPITSDDYPLPARRPRRPLTNKDKVKRVFGIEMPQWDEQLRSYARELAAQNGHGLDLATHSASGGR